MLFWRFFRGDITHNNSFSLSIYIYIYKLLDVDLHGCELGDSGSRKLVEALLEAKVKVKALLQNALRAHRRHKLITLGTNLAEFHANWVNLGDI